MAFAAVEIFTDRLFALFADEGQRLVRQDLETLRLQLAPDRVALLAQVVSGFGEVDRLLRRHRHDRRRWRAR